MLLLSYPSRDPTALFGFYPNSRGRGLVLFVCLLSEEAQSRNEGQDLERQVEEDWAQSNIRRRALWVLLVDPAPEPSLQGWVGLWLERVHEDWRVSRWLEELLLDAEGLGVSDALSGLLLDGAGE